MASIRCAHCKQTHASVAEVRACALAKMRPRPPRPMPLRVAVAETYEAMERERARQNREAQDIGLAEDAQTFNYAADELPSRIRRAIR